MDIRNVHERRFAVPAARVGALIDSLATDDDPLWPHERWPAMRFDRPLAVGASGGHGPVRYTVEAYEPGRIVRFRFHRPRGFDGFHAFEVEADRGGTILRHVLEMRTHGPARVSWRIVFRPLHDALIEDCLDEAERSLTGRPARRARGSVHVRLLRAAMTAALRGRRRPR